MKRVKVLLVATYEGMAINAVKLSKQRADLDVTVVYGALREGVRAAEQVFDDSYDVIISRGGTTELLQQHFQIPVIDIEFSAIDIIRLMKMTDKPSQKKVIVGSKSMADMASIICELIGQNICTEVLPLEEAPRDCLKKLAKEGYNFVVGDACVHEEAARLGMDSALWTSGIDSLRKAFDLAASIGKTVRSMHCYNALYRELISKSQSYFYVENGDTREPVFDSVPLQAVQKKKIIKLLHATDCVEVDMPIFIEGFNTDWTGEIRHISTDDNKITVFILRECPAGENYPAICSYTSMQTASDTFMRAAYNGSGGVFLDDAETYGKTMLPVLIEGETGIGKATLADYIHKKSANRKRPFLMVDCGRMNEDIFASYLESGWLNRCFANNLTLCFCHLDSLPEELQSRLTIVLKQALKNDKFRLIATIEKDYEYVKRNKIISKPLLSFFSECRIRISPLRERIDSLRDISDFMFRQFNETYGLPAAKLTDSAIDELKSCEWPNNLRQFRQTMLEIVKGTKGFYINRKETREAIERCSKKTLQAETGILLDTGKTLKEMTRDIVKHVIDEENGNQTRAALRLGVGRSTIWRILQDK